MPHQSGTYPLSVTEFQFDCLPTPIDVIVVASDKHFGVLVSLTNLPQVILPEGCDDGMEVLFHEVTDMFGAFALDYTEAAEEHGLVGPLPDCETIDMEVIGVFLELSGRIPKSDDRSAEKKELVLSGQYFFIAELGVDISEFIVNTDEEGNKVSMH